MVDNTVMSVVGLNENLKKKEFNSIIMENIIKILCIVNNQIIIIYKINFLLFISAFFISYEN